MSAADRAWTPGEWHVDLPASGFVKAPELDGKWTAIVLSCGPQEVAVCRNMNIAQDELMANAHRIVQCVNSHDDLYEALEGVLPYMEAAEAKGLVGDEGCHWPVEAVRVALASARAGEAE